MRPTYRVVRPLLALALALAVLPAPALAGKPPKRGSTRTDFVPVATHPQAVQQPTTMGRTIATLKAFNGKLYSGYGDYGANTGPIAITPLSSSAFAGTPELAAADTEAIWSYRTINGKLYAPSIDPRVSSDFAVGATGGEGMSWANLTAVGTTHAFDIVTLTGADLWLVGSSGSDAVAWRSTDGGSNWSEMLRVPARNAAGGEFARFYGAAVLGGKLYVQAMDSSSGMQPASKVFDGQSWGDGPSLSLFTHAETFAGKALFNATYHSAHYAGQLRSFDGSGVTTAYSSIWDYTVEGGTVYVLAGDGKVMASQDAKTWTQVGTAPSVARSIGVLNGTVYVGGTDSTIYRK